MIGGTSVSDLVPAALAANRILEIPASSGLGEGVERLFSRPGLFHQTFLMLKTLLQPRACAFSRAAVRLFDLQAGIDPRFSGFV